MSNFNRFGKLYTDVMSLYPGTVVADYDAGGAAGQTKIEDALDRAVFMVAAALPPALYKALTNVDAEEISNFATQGQTDFNLGMFPVVAGTVHLWRYPLLVPNGSTWSGAMSPWGADWYKPPSMGYNEVSTTDYSVTALTGAIAYTGTSAINKGERIYATYNVNRDAATFACGMLGQVAVLGAAAELGAMLFSTPSQEWALVTKYATSFDSLIAQIKDGSLVPDEVRKLKYFTEIERMSNEVRSVRLLRG